MNSITGSSSSAILHSRTANRMNTSQNNSFGDWLPRKETVTAMTAFSALATTTIGLTYLFCRATGLYKHSDTPLDNEDFESTGLALLSTAVAATGVLFNRLGLIGVIGVDAKLFDNGENQLILESSNSSVVRIEEIDDCDKTIAQLLPQVLSEVSTCRIGKLPRQNRTEFQLLKDRGLASNLELAEEIFKEMQKTGLISPNNLVRSKKLLYERARKQGLELKNFSSLITAGDQCLSKMRKIPNVHRYTSFEEKKITAQIAEKTRLGICAEMASIAFFKGLKKGVWNTQLEVVTIPNGDHAFLVIGRKPGSNPMDYNTWGPSAVALDSWAERDNIFLIKEIKMHLKAYHGRIDMETGEPWLTPFNPHKHYLQIGLVNIYTSQSLLNYANRVPMSPQQTHSFQKMIKKLERFRQTEHLQTKLDLATELVDLCSDNSIESIPAVKVLREQVEYFIELSHL